MYIYVCICIWYIINYILYYTNFYMFWIGDLYTYTHRINICWKGGKMRNMKSAKHEICFYQKWETWIYQKKRILIGSLGFQNIEIWAVLEGTFPTLCSAMSSLKDVCLGSPKHHLGPVFVCLGCYNKNTENWVVYEQQTLISQFTGWEVQDHGTGRFSIWWGPTLQLRDGCVFTQKRWGALWGFASKGANLMHEGSTLLTSSPPRGLTSQHHHTWD